MTDATKLTGDVPGLLRSLALPLAVGGIGGAATSPNIEPWYDTLDKPPFTPPRWAFSPAWTTLYLLMGLAHHIVSRTGGDPAIARRAQALYGLQLGLNGFWSILFFGRRSPLAGLVEIGFLCVAIALTIAAFARISKPAALLLVPYLLWTSFAAVLNAEIWRRNR